MQYIKGMESYNDTCSTAITLGKFDGLHIGHQKLIDRIRFYANEDVKSVLFSFDMVPFFLERGIQKQNLMTNEERMRRLDGQVDYLVECPFTDEICRMEAETFIEEILVGKFHAKYIVVGTDFHFGHEKRGDYHMLADYAKKYGYTLEVVEKERYENEIVSSTYIRSEVAKGNVKLAANLLGYPYTIIGTVKKGNQFGRKLGIPTMNVETILSKILPPNGVYVSRVKVDGIWWNGISNVGSKPTVSEAQKVLVEVHLLDYQGSAYGKEIEVELLEFRRPEQKFHSVEQLKTEMEKDVAYAKLYFHK